MNCVGIDSLVFWFVGVLPGFVISNVALFIILIIKILRLKKASQTESDSTDTSEKLQKVWNQWYIIMCPADSGQVLSNKLWEFEIWVQNKIAI